MNALFQTNNVAFVVIFPGPPFVSTKNRSNEFIANMIQRIKIDSKNPRLGYVGCQPNIDEGIPLDHVQYNALFSLFPGDAVGPEQVKEMSQIIRDRNNFNVDGVPPRSQCIENAMNQFVPNDGRNKKIVLVSNCSK